jgi:hypothetical protein
LKCAFMSGKCRNLMPIDDERRFLNGGDGFGERKYHNLERPTPAPENTVPDSIQQKLQELQEVLEASREDRKRAQIKSKEREKGREDAERARQSEKNERYEQLQQKFRRVRELEDDGRRADAEGQIHGSSSQLF